MSVGCVKCIFNSKVHSFSHFIILYSKKSVQSCTATGIIIIITTTTIINVDFHV